jgi:GNAT superfamily N-acetyltransferase
MITAGHEARDSDVAAIVRRASTADASIISWILRAAFREFAPFYTAEAYDATVVPPARVRERMAEGPVWVAVAGDRLVGTAGAVVRGSALYIRGVAVVPVARGERIGELLLDEIERFALADGHDVLELHTTTFLLAARRLYERCGFTLLGPAGSPHGTPLIAMQKRLTARCTSGSRTSPADPPSEPR